LDSARTSSARSQTSARLPLLSAALAFASGLWIGRCIWRPASWWVVAASVFLLSAIYFVHKKKRIPAGSILAFSAIFAAGALTIQIQGSPPGDSALWLGGGEQVLITAHVIAEGDVQSDGPGSFHQRIDVQTEEIESGDEARLSRPGVRLNIYSQIRTNSPQDSQSMRLLHYGERIGNGHCATQLPQSRSVRLRGVSARTWHHGNSFRKIRCYRITSGIFRQPNRAVAHPRSPQHHPKNSLWPEQIAALMDAIVIGEESFIGRQTRMDFQRSGTYHVLVVSGMNVSILAMFALWSLRKLGLGDIAASMCAIALILAYAALTNVGPPVWRAALMFAVYLATRLLYRNKAMLNALGAAALALLIADPHVLFGASFQMTFLCVALVAGVGIPILERTIEPYSRGLRNLDALAYDRSLPPQVAQFRLDLRLILGRCQAILPGRAPAFFLVRSLRVLLAFCELVLMSAILQLGLALPMAFCFHRATSVPLPANLLVIPFLQLLMPAAVLAIFVSYISLALAKIPAAIAGFALQGIAGTVRWLGGLRLADIRVPTPGTAVIICAVVAIVVCVVLLRGRTRLAMVGVAALAASALWIWTVPPRPQLRPRVLEMTAIDVGQGDSILLVLPDGHKLLVDAGGLPFWTHSQLDIGEDVVSPYLWARGISHLDAIALTHAHADHMGGMPAVIANFHPRELWLPAGIPDEEIHNLLSQARQLGMVITYRQAGDSFSYGGATIRVLAPSPDLALRSSKSTSHRNDESLVMKVSYEKTSALLEADAEKPTEKLVSTEDPRADVLKVAHHGSASSTNVDLLEAVQPQFAVISVGARNVYRQPRFEVLERLQGARVKTYRTDADGATSFYLDGQTVTSEVAGFH